MQPISLFDLAAKQARWLSVRQSTIAGNVANANTPGFVAADVESFDRVLKKLTPSMQATDGRHLGGEFGSAMPVGLRRDEADVATIPSGNTVVLEDEMVKAADVRRAFEMNTAIVKAFHRMFMMTARG